MMYLLCGLLLGLIVGFVVGCGATHTCYSRDLKSGRAISKGVIYRVMKTENAES